MVSTACVLARLVGAREWTRRLQDLKMPPTSHFLLAAAGIADGAARPGEQVAGTVSLKHVYEIAKVCHVAHVLAAPL